MIAKLKTGTSFMALANYMEQEQKMEFKEARNLTGDYKSHYVRMMDESASLSSRVEQPVYHVTLSYAEEDNPSKDMMLEDADQVLEELGLGEHQAVIVGHNDEEYKHLHLMVNRVHPIEGKAWNPWNDRDRAKAILRDIEKQRGYRQVSEKNWGKGKGMSNGEIHQLRDHGLDNPPLKFKSQFYDFKGGFEKAENWKDIEDLLKEAGCRIKPKGRGGVIEDRSTGKQMKLSRVDRKFSFGELQKEHGNYKEWKAQERKRKQELARQRQAEIAKKQALAKKKEDINNKLMHPDALEDENPYRRVKRCRGYDSWERVEQNLSAIDLELRLHNDKPAVVQTATNKGVYLSSWEEGSNKVSDFNAQKFQSFKNYKFHQKAGQYLENNQRKLGLSLTQVKQIKKFLEQHQTGNEAEAKKALKTVLSGRAKVNQAIKIFKTLANFTGAGKAVTAGQSIAGKVLSQLNEISRGRGRERGGRGR
ncbi:relaxase/mobilization nuclease domain-containing protein [Candidatus Saccharibacteria bacterium]|nr:relaxase/mobilization nuclease domain-containing protein [Candidatus Saccharibacteria bacterium]NIW80906.1 relaxase/mobilization nuclease domain-containing protein [Calditrichia bacterium]